MSFFEKKPDERIDKLIDSNNSIIEAIKDINEKHLILMDHVLKIAEIQGQHKEFIQFIVKHATVSPDAQGDLIKMIQNMNQISKLAEKGKKKK